jgi:hypothetical protein
MPNPTLVLPLWWIDSIALEIVPRPPYGLDLTPSDFWLFSVLKKTSQKN